MELKESEVILIELAKLSVSESKFMEVNDNIWKAFRMGIEYRKELIKEWESEVVEASDE